MLLFSLRTFLFVVVLLEELPSLEQQAETTNMKRIMITTQPTMFSPALQYMSKSILSYCIHMALLCEK